MDEIIKRPESAEDARREAEIRAHPHIKGGVLEFVFRIIDGERAKSDGLRIAALEEAASLLDMVAALDDESEIGEEAADAFNADPVRRPMMDRLRDWNGVLSKHIRALSASPSPTLPHDTGDPASPSRDRASHGAADGVSTLRASPAIASNKCAGGVRLPKGDAPCTVCGAGQKDTCGRWVGMADQIVAAAQELYRKVRVERWHCNAPVIDLFDAVEAMNKAQGIVTGGQDPQGLGEREARVEPGPKDAPEGSGIPPTTVKGETL